MITDLTAVTVIFASLFLRETNESVGFSGKDPGPLYFRWERAGGHNKINK